MAARNNSGKEFRGLGGGNNYKVVETRIFDGFEKSVLRFNIKIIGLIDNNNFIGMIERFLG